MKCNTPLGVDTNLHMPKHTVQCSTCMLSLHTIPLFGMIYVCWDWGCMYLTSSFLGASTLNVVTDMLEQRLPERHQIPEA